MNTGSGLGAIPILQLRPYLEAANDIHSRERDFAVRAPLADDVLKC